MVLHNPIKKRNFSAKSIDIFDLMAPRISLEQWRALVAVVEQGGYAPAAESLHKTQSTVTYAVQKIESLLGVALFETVGRRAQLTQPGAALYRRARLLLDEAAALEHSAAGLAAGWEAQIRLAVDTIFPTWLLLRTLATFAELRQETRIDLHEMVLGGTDEALLAGEVDLAIAATMPPGFLGDPLLNVVFVAVAAPEHPLHRLGRELHYRDLRRHRQLVLRDSGTRRDRDAGWLGAEQRWTMSHKATSIRAACMGLGFAWYPQETISEELAAGLLKPLPLSEGATRHQMLYLVIADRDGAGPGTRALARLLRDAAATCPDTARPATPTGPKTAG